MGALKLKSDVPHEFAKVLGLRYVSDNEPGIYRKSRGKSFYYVDHQGKPVRNQALLKRIRSLVLPPAWTSVWICKHDDGHLQATGRDKRGRKQYRYHADWSHHRNENKFQKLQRFGTLLPKIRERVKKDLSKPGMPREKVLAAVIQVLELSGIRVGNEIYSRENKTFGLTTIRNHHAEVKGSRVRFSFRGKSGVKHDVEITDPHLSRIIRKCQELPGQELFAYVDDDGKAQDISSTDVNAYLKDITGEEITAKDFRTWAGTVKATDMLCKLGRLENECKTARKKREVEVIKSVAEHLGNTVAVCRKYYVDPRVFSADECGSMHDSLKVSGPRGLNASEKLLLHLLCAKVGATKLRAS